MNYQHIFHAGNHTEVFKHAVLCMLLDELAKKPKALTVLDTHAGAGVYDLLSPEAQKTGEAREGIGRVLHKDIPSASRYLNVVRQHNGEGPNRYPGSPALVRALLRDDDRLIACELRADDAARLRRTFRADRQVSIHQRDGYEAIGAFLPLPHRRGLVFIDPPFEERNEFERLAFGLNAGIKKWPTGIFLAWYPLKDRTGIQRLQAQYRPSNPPTLCCEFLRQPLDGTTLAGSGLILCNPPWRFETKLEQLCRELLAAFEAIVGSYALHWWIREGATKPGGGSRSAGAKRP